MRSTIAVLGGALLLCACSTESPPAASPSTTSAPSEATSLAPSALASAVASPVAVAGGCAGTQAYAGPGPDAAIGLADNPWAWATPESAGIVAYFWHSAPGLIVANDPNGGTKVLWVAHDADGGELTISGHPAHAGGAVVQVVAPAAESPANNYPSLLDLPTSGCWHLDLTLGAVHAAIALAVAAAP